MDEDTKATLLVSVCASIVFAFGCMAGCDGGRKMIERDAVRAGYAEYYIDADMDKQWRWKPTQLEEPTCP
jgi:hypothetical protein